jgi:hypothetical protein
MVGTPSHPSPTKWEAQGGPLRGRIIVKSGTVDKGNQGAHFSDEEKDKLLMCPDSFVPRDLKEQIMGRKFDDSLPSDKGPNRGFNWETKQEEIKPKFILDEIMGHLGDKPPTGPSGSSGSSGPTGSSGSSGTGDDQTLFHECVAAKVNEELRGREFMEEMMFLGPKLGECIETLDQDRCDQGFSDTFISLPAALRRTKTTPGSMSETQRDPLSFKDQGLVLDEMIHQSAENERELCKGVVSETTRALQEKRRYEIDFPDISSLWLIKDGDGLGGSLAKIINFIVIITAIYVIGISFSSY